MIHPIRRHRSGFTVIDLMAVGVVVVIVVVLIVVLLPTSGSNARMARQMANNTQLRGIHQAFVTWAQSNRTGGSDGYFPGLDASGNVIPNGPLTGHSGNGTQPAARLWMMLEGNYFPPEYLLNPADTASIEAMGRDASGLYPPLTATNHSYALLQITAPSGPTTPPDGRTFEWRETLNTAAVVMGDRAIGTGPSDFHSVWTKPGSHDWLGGVVRNDNSTGFETSTRFANTKYGNHPTNAFDELFEDESGGNDAFLVHEDATTAYSAD